VKIARLLQEFTGAYHLIAPDGSIFAFSVSLEKAKRIAERKGWELR